MVPNTIFSVVQVIFNIKYNLKIKYVVPLQQELIEPFSSSPSCCNDPSKHMYFKYTESKFNHSIDGENKQPLRF